MENNEFIRVYCRVRPANEKEKTSIQLYYDLYYLVDNQQCVQCQSPYIRFSTDSTSNHNFIFDSVFDEHAKQVLFCWIS